ncbi:MAG TPA: DinB family protein [Fulvivirga sp.]|nr:DinB family protein [Fulvivirga sp.]
MSKPSLNELPQFYRKYVEAVSYDDLIPGLIGSGNETIDLMKSIPEKSGDYKYGPDKWTVKQVLTHMIDAERVFAYRALRFARNDKTELSGFEENDWAPEANASNRKLYKIIEEYNNVRASTVDLFASCSEEMLKRVGTANGSQMSVNAIGFVIIGHETHHRKILNERYFS